MVSGFVMALDGTYGPATEPRSTTLRPMAHLRRAVLKNAAVARPELVPLARRDKKQRRSARLCHKPCLLEAEIMYKSEDCPKSSLA